MTFSGVPVAVERVSKTFHTEAGTIEAIRDISFSAEAGSFVALVGPSGCGKSTLLRLVAGLTPTTSGVVQVGNQDVTGPRTDLGFAFQRDCLLEWRTVLDNVLLQPEMRGLRKSTYKRRALDLLSQVGLERFVRSYPAELSGGMRQRVALARALVMDVPLLLLDEPFGALDAFTREQLNIDLQYLWWTTRPTILFVTHSISEALFLADKVVVMTSDRPEGITVIDVPIKRPRMLAVRSTGEFNQLTHTLRAIFAEHGDLREPTYS